MSTALGFADMARQWLEVQDCSPMYKHMLADARAIQI